MNWRRRAGKVDVVERVFDAVFCVIGLGLVVVLAHGFGWI